MRVGVTAVGVALVAGLSAAGPSHATFPAQQQRLAVVTEEGGFGASLELIGADGKKLGIGPPLGVAGSAAFGADGTHVALNLSIPYDPGDPSTADLETGTFLSDEGGEIAQNVALGGRPSWSPDSTMIAYAAKASGRWDVFVSPAAGGSATDLTNDPANDRNPRWAPDGSRILFESDRTGNWEIFSMAPDGSGVVNLTNDPAEDRLGDWSPDSSRIVFSSTRTGGGDLYLMPAGGGAATRLTSLPGADTHAAWSPDSTTIAFSNDGEGSPDVYEIAPDGSNLRRVTDNSYADIVQDWQPLTDTEAPVVHALQSAGKRGRRVALRFRVSDASGRAAVLLDIEYSTKHGVTGIEGQRVVSSVNPSRVYVFSLPAREFRGAPRSFRFCLHGFDASLNQSSRSCARFTFRKTRKR